MTTNSDTQNILLVDDKRENLFAMEQLLSSETTNYKLLETTSGVNALKIAYSEPVDLILLDVQMPEMDGYQVASLLKNNSKTKDIPLIFVTAINKEEQHILKGYEFGGVDYLFKPLNPSVTRAKVKALLEMRKLQKQLEEKQLALKKSNEELEKFAYVVAHDLNSPLHSITGLLKLLEMDLKDRMNSKENEYFDYILGSVDRMQSLIFNLLEYAKIDSSGKQFGEINTMKVLENVYLNLQSIIEEKKVQISSPPLPNIYGDEILITQLFQNFISNAIKFQTTNSPKISIYAEIKSNEVVFSITDNGIGIDKNNLTKIFQIFHRLHSTKDFEGSGIGLAICKKIVELHGGKIWVKSEPGFGSTFYFTIKRQIS